MLPLALRTTVLGPQAPRALLQLRRLLLPALPANVLILGGLVLGAPHRIQEVDAHLIRMALDRNQFEHVDRIIQTGAAQLVRLAIHILHKRPPHLLLRAILQAETALQAVVDGLAQLVRQPGAVVDGDDAEDDDDELGAPEGDLRVGVAGAAGDLGDFVDQQVVGVELAAQGGAVVGHVERVGVELGGEEVVAPEGAGCVVGWPEEGVVRFGWWVSEVFALTLW